MKRPARCQTVLKKGITSKRRSQRILKKPSSGYRRTHYASKEQALRSLRDWIVDHNRVPRHIKVPVSREQSREKTYAQMLWTRSKTKQVRSDVESLLWDEIDSLRRSLTKRLSRGAGSSTDPPEGDHVQTPPRKKKKNGC